MLYVPPDSQESFFCYTLANKEFKKKGGGGCCCGTAEMNPNSIHEDASSIPDLTQWVRDPVLP